MKAETKELNRQEMEQVAGGAGIEECVKWAIEKYGVNTTVEEVMNYMGDYRKYYEKYASPEQIQQYIDQYRQKWENYDWTKWTTGWDFSWDKH